MRTHGYFSQRIRVLKEPNPYILGLAAVRRI